MDALRASAPGLRLDNPAMLVTSAVGTAANGQASRYTYLAGELADGPAVWAAVDIYQHGGWLAVNGLAKTHSSAPSADSTDAAVSRNISDYSQVVGCTAEGGFPGGAPFSPPPDGEG